MTDEAQLQNLERTLVRGQQAHEQRDRLLAKMHHDGLSLQALANVLNDARRSVSGPLITRAGVYAAIRRQPR